MRGHFKILVLTCTSLCSLAVADTDVRLSTCSPQLVTAPLSLCCHTKNVPRSSTIVIRRLDSSGKTTSITTTEALCNSINNVPVQGPHVQIRCSRQNEWDVYSFTFSKAIQNADLGQWWCGNYDSSGYYGNSATYTLTKDNVLTDHSYLYVSEGEITRLSWQRDATLTSDESTTVKDPRSNVILTLSGTNVTFISDGYTWLGRKPNGSETISWENTARENSGTYVIISNGTDGVTRKGVTLIVSGVPDPPSIQITAFGFDQETNIGYIALSCQASSTSAAPLFYKPEMTYTWYKTVVTPETTHVSTEQRLADHSMTINRLDCNGNVSYKIICEVTEHGLARNSSQAFEPIQHWPCNSDSVPAQPPASDDDDDDDQTPRRVLYGLLAFTIIALVYSTVSSLVLGRRRIVRRLRQCQSLRCCGRVASAALYCCDNVEPDNDDMIDEQRRYEADHGDIFLNRDLRQEVGLGRSRFDNFAFDLSGSSTSNGGASAVAAGSSAFEPDATLNNVEELLRQHHKHLKEPVIQLDIYRENIVNNLIAHYTLNEDNLAISRVNVNMIGEQGLDYGGVSNDMFTTFWNIVWEMELFVGNQVVVPHLPIHQMSEKQKFLAIGRIFSHTVAVTRSFPIPMSRCAIVTMIFQVNDIDREAVIQDFLSYLEDDIRHLVEKALRDFASLNSDEKETLSDVCVERFEYAGVLREHTFRQDIFNIANDVICIKPRPLLDQMRNGIPESHLQHFWSLLDIDSLGAIFRALEPTPDRVIGRIESDIPERTLNKLQKNSLDMLRQLIRESTRQELETLLHFITGSKTMPRTMIKIVFTTQDGLARSPKAHTCSNMLELPDTYEDYDTFKREMRNLLESQEAFVMTMQ